MAAHARREETRAELVCKNVAIERGRANVRSHPGSEGVVAGKKWKNSERTLFRGNTHWQPVKPVDRQRVL